MNIIIIAIECFRCVTWASKSTPQEIVCVYVFFLTILLLSPTLTLSFPPLSVATGKIFVLPIASNEKTKQRNDTRARIPRMGHKNMAMRAVRVSVCV